MTKTERDELRANVQKHNKRAALTVEMPAVAVIALLDAADERDRLREEIARWHPTAIAPVVEPPRKDCGVCAGTGHDGFGHFCRQCEGYGVSP